MKAKEKLEEDGQGKA
jgi:hypothetical protein